VCITCHLFSLAKCDFILSQLNGTSRGWFSTSVRLLSNIRPPVYKSELNMSVQFVNVLVGVGGAGGRSVDVVSDYGLDDRSSIPGRGKGFSL
jgi:hypothetical protein